MPLILEMWVFTRQFSEVIAPNNHENLLDTTIQAGGTICSPVSFLKVVIFNNF